MISNLASFCQFSILFETRVRRMNLRVGGEMNQIKSIKLITSLLVAPPFQNFYPLFVSRRPNVKSFIKGIFRRPLMR